MRLGFVTAIFPEWSLPEVFQFAAEAGFYGGASARIGDILRFRDVSVMRSANGGDLIANAAPVGIGEVMRAFSAGTVVASRHPNYHEGDAVMGMLGWQEYAISDGKAITRKVKESDLPL